MRGMAMDTAPKKGMSIEVEIKKGGTEGSPEEAAVMGEAKKLDAVVDESYRAAAPEGEYSLGGLNSLVDSLNTVLGLFGGGDYPRFSEGTGSFPAPFVKALSMVNAAADAAGLDEMVIDMGGLVDDRSLKMAGGKLRALAGNAAFKRFLKSERPEPGAAPAPAPAPEVGRAPMSGDDDMMMSRLG